MGNKDQLVLAGQEIDMERAQCDVGWPRGNVGWPRGNGGNRFSLVLAG